MGCQQPLHVAGHLKCFILVTQIPEIKEEQHIKTRKCSAARLDTVVIIINFCFPYVTPQGCRATTTLIRSNIVVCMCTHVHMAIGCVWVMPITIQQPLLDHIMWCACTQKPVVKNNTARVMLQGVVMATVRKVEYTYQCIQFPLDIHIHIHIPVSQFLHQGE